MEFRLPLSLSRGPQSAGRTALNCPPRGQTCNSSWFSLSRGNKHAIHQLYCGQGSSGKAARLHRTNLRSACRAQTSLEKVAWSRELMGVVILNFGSSGSAESNTMLVQFASLYRQVTKRDIVEVAHVEDGEPTLEQAVRGCMQKGAEYIMVVPYFFSRGSYTLQDLPFLVADMQQQVRGAKCIIAEPIGMDTLLVDLIESRVRAVEQRPVELAERGWQGGQAPAKPAELSGRGRGTQLPERTRAGIQRRAASAPAAAERNWGQQRKQDGVESPERAWGAGQGSFESPERAWAAEQRRDGVADSPERNWGGQQRTGRTESPERAWGAEQRSVPATDSPERNWGGEQRRGRAAESPERSWVAQQPRTTPADSPERNWGGEQRVAESPERSWGGGQRSSPADSPERSWGAGQQQRREEAAKRWQKMVN